MTESVTRSGVRDTREDSRRLRNHACMVQWSVDDHLVQVLVRQHGDVVLGLDPAEERAGDRPPPLDVRRRYADGRRAGVRAQDDRLPPALHRTVIGVISIATDPSASCQTTYGRYLPRAFEGFRHE